MSKIKVRSKKSKVKNKLRMSCLDNDIRETIDRLVNRDLSRPMKRNKRLRSKVDDPPEVISKGSNFGSPEDEVSSRPPPVSFIDLTTKDNVEAHAHDVKLSELEEAYRDATTWNNGAGLFLSWQDKLAGPLYRSYRLLLAIIDGGTSAFYRVLQDRYYAGRKRKPGAKKAALLAVQVVAKPREIGEVKACSAYAKLLERAVALEVPLEEFVDRMADEPLRAPKTTHASTVADPEQQVEADFTSDGNLQDEDGKPPSLPLHEAANAILVDENGLLDGRQDVLVTVHYSHDSQGLRVLEVRSVDGDSRPLA